MTNNEIVKAYIMAYKQANVAAHPGMARRVPLSDRVRAFFSRRPANVINGAGNRVNPAVNTAQPANLLQQRNQLLAGN